MSGYGEWLEGGYIFLFGGFLFKVRGCMSIFADISFGIRTFFGLADIVYKFGGFSFAYGRFLPGFGGFLPSDKTIFDWRTTHLAENKKELILNLLFSINIDEKFFLFI